MHPRFTTRDGQVYWAAEIGPFGAWGDLTRITRWGNGACGNFEVSFTMPLPATFSHPALRRGTLVSLMAKSRQRGSSFQITAIEKGNLGEPWKITAEGVGRLVEGQSSFYAFDGSFNITVNPTTAVTQAISLGLPWGGVDSTVQNSNFGSAGEPETIGALLSRIGTDGSTRWGLFEADDKAGFRSDPTTPTLEITPTGVSLGTSGEEYATQVFVRYTNSTSHANATVRAPSSTPDIVSEFGSQQYLVNLTTAKGYPEMSATAAQNYANGIYAKAKGRLAFTDRLTLTANELLAVGGRPANLGTVTAGQMVRAHGIRDQLLRVNGKTYLDFIIGETRYTDGAQSIDIAPAGLAATDLESIVEDITGMASAA